MYEGYLEMGGQEIVNSARAAAYAAAHGVQVTCPQCEDLPEALGDDPYTLPAQDGAPWYDPAVPESAGVLGLLGLGVAGFGQNPASRDPTELAGGGAALGAPRRAAREIGWNTVMIALDEQALSYGIAWLASALEGGCASTCDGESMCVFVSCPTDGATGLGNDQIRYLYDVGLLEGPALGEVHTSAGGVLVATVTFTVVAGESWIYREPLAAFPGWADLADGTVITGYDPDAIECVEPAPCLEDPTCPAPPLPPLPPVPLSPCYPTGPGTFRRTLLRLDPQAPPQWLTTVPVLQLHTGDTALRRLVVRFWANPAGLDCEQVSDPCQACYDVTVPYLPAGSILTVDGRLRRARVECPRGPVGTAVSTPALFGRGGQTFSWPEFPCPTSLCVELLSQADATAANARALVQLIPRQAAA